MSLISISSLFSNLSEYENAINAHFLYFEKTDDGEQDNDDRHADNVVHDDDDDDDDI